MMLDEEHGDEYEDVDCIKTVMWKQSANNKILTKLINNMHYSKCMHMLQTINNNG